MRQASGLLCFAAIFLLGSCRAESAGTLNSRDIYRPEPTRYLVAAPFPTRPLATRSSQPEDPSIEFRDPIILAAATEPVPPSLAAAPAFPGIEQSQNIQLSSIRPAEITAVNGIPIESFVVISEAVRQNMAEIFARGQQMGRQAQAFSKIGDSTISHPFFLARFDTGPYNLGKYDYLENVIDYYAGSFGRESMAVRVGFHTWTVLDPLWADKTQCLPAETPVACEYRLQSPAIVLIRLGSNDAGVPDLFDRNMRQIVAYTIENGIIPVLGTKADRFEGPANTNNNILRQIAADYQIPLWDYDLVAETLPGRGLDVDNVHMTTFYAHDYTRPEALQRGHGAHNLTALLVLDIIRQIVMVL
jgi:hypothetical protein